MRKELVLTYRGAGPIDLCAPLAVSAQRCFVSTFSSIYSQLGAVLAELAASCFYHGGGRASLLRDTTSLLSYHGGCRARRFCASHPGRLAAVLLLRDAEAQGRDCAVDAPRHECACVAIVHADAALSVQIRRESTVGHRGRAAARRPRRRHAPALAARLAHEGLSANTQVV